MMGLQSPSGIDQFMVMFQSLSFLIYLRLILSPRRFNYYRESHLLLGFALSPFRAGLL